MRLFLALVAASGLLAAERTVDPTFLRRSVSQIREVPVDLTTSTCHYRPIFGTGDAQAKIPRGVARYGEVTVDAGGECKSVQYTAEEQAYVVLDGSGSVIYAGQKAGVRKNDFLYLPPGIAHALSAAPGGPLRVMIMGFRIPAGSGITPPAKLEIANIDEVKRQTVGGHPDTVLYQLLMGDTSSTRDRIAAAHVLTSLYVMEFAPGGTNFPHHHETEEEIYLLLDGSGDMVAGGGMDGVEGRHPARPGDAYFFRLNCTVGFYANKDPSVKARILAVRSRFPFRAR